MPHVLELHPKVKYFKCLDCRGGYVIRPCQQGLKPAFTGYEVRRTTPFGLKDTNTP
jgi:hypothetical protein